MRISALIDDPDFSPDARYYAVFLDGEDISNRCYAVDEESGIAWCYVINENGSVVLNETKTDVLKECKYGEIVLVDKRK